MFRQGDVLIVRVNDFPKDCKATHSDIVLTGETTGHAHRIKDGNILSLGESLFIEAGVNTTLVHEEHDTIEIPQGKYKVIRQREYDENEIRYVSD